MLFFIIECEYFIEVCVCVCVLGSWRPHLWDPCSSWACLSSVWLYWRDGKTSFHRSLV